MEKTTILIAGLLLTFILIAIFIHRKDSILSLDFNSKIRLLPFWVKIAGLAIAIFSLIIHWIDLFGSNMWFGYFWQFGFVFGLLLICLSKEKTEDEMLIQARLNSVFIAFFGGIIAHIILVLLDLLMGASIDSFNSLYLISFILFYYLINFQLSKRKLSK